MKKWISGLLAGAMALCLAAAPAVRADSQKVVTLGANLSDSQRAAILKYFGVDEDDAGIHFLTITNQDEHEHLDAYVAKELIGTRTFSCAYVSPTSKGGIRVKTANLNWVTSNMIATTLSTSGIVNCDVIAASPIPVSGTGALTGVIMAYEEASGETLDEDRKELATQELVTTIDLAEDLGQAEATALINDIKVEIIANQIIDENEVDAIVEDVITRVEEIEAEKPAEQQVVLSEEDRAMIKDLAQQIADQKYDYEEMKDTLQRVEENVQNIEAGDVTNITNNDNSVTNNSNVTNIDNSVTNTDNSVTNTDNSVTNIDNSSSVVNGDSAEEDPDSILNFTDDSALGEGVVMDSTNREDNLPTEAAIEAVPLDEPAVIAEETTEAPEIVTEETTEAPAAEPLSEEEPAETTEAAPEQAVMDSQVYADAALNGVVYLWVAGEDAVPVSGQLVIRSADDSDLAVVDLTDASRVIACPVDEVLAQKVEASSGTVFVILTGTEAQAYFGSDKAFMVAGEVQAAGEVYEIESGSEIPASPVGISAELSALKDRSSGSVLLTAVSDGTEGSVQITSLDPAVAVTVPDAIGLAGESTELYYLTDGTAGFTFTFTAADGTKLEEAVLALPAEGVTPISAEELAALQEAASDEEVPVIGDGEEAEADFEIQVEESEDFAGEEAE